MKKVLALTLLTLNLLGCIPQPIQTTPTESPATVTEAPPTSTPVTPTLTQPPSPTQTQPTAITVPSLEQIVYYYFVNPKEAAFPAGSIIVMPEAYILAPILSGAALAPEADANLRSALEAALKDSRNGWISNKLEIVKVAFGDGRARWSCKANISAWVMSLCSPPASKFCSPCSRMRMSELQPSHSMEIRSAIWVSPLASMPSPQTMYLPA